MTPTLSGAWFSVDDIEAVAKAMLHRCKRARWYAYRNGLRSLHRTPKRVWFVKRQRTVSETITDFSGPHRWTTRGLIACRYRHNEDLCNRLLAMKGKALAGRIYLTVNDAYAVGLAESK